MTSFQCIATAFLCWILGVASSYFSRQSILSEFPKQEYSYESARRILPLSLVFVGMIAFNNLCLKFVTVSFYNVARSLTIVFNVIFTYTLLHTSTSAKVLMTLAVVIFGFFVGSEGEVNFSLVGTLFGVCSSIFVSLNSIYTKKSLHIVDNNMWRLVFYNNVNAAMLFVPIFLVTGEFYMMYEQATLLFSSVYWLKMVGAGILGFLMGIVTTLQIKVTSPLTHNISGTAKACVQTILAIFIYNTETTTGGMIGICAVIFGSGAYAYVRMVEETEAKAQADLAALKAKVGNDIELGPTKA